MEKGQWFPEVCYKLGVVVSDGQFPSLGEGEPCSCGEPEVAPAAVYKGS